MNPNRRTTHEKTDQELCISRTLPHQLLLVLTVLSSNLGKADLSLEPSFPSMSK